MPNLIGFYGHFETADDVPTPGEEYNYFLFSLPDDGLYLIDPDRNITGPLSTMPAPSTGWSITNKSEDKVLDCNSTSIDELADVLGTLIDELKTYGILGA